MGGKTHEEIALQLNNNDNNNKKSKAVGEEKQEVCARNAGTIRHFTRTAVSRPKQNDKLGSRIEGCKKKKKTGKKN